MEFHKTPYLGPLIDAAVLTSHREQYASAVTHNDIALVGESPETARKAGDKVSGRVLSATTNFPQVGMCKPEIHLRERKGLSSLTAMLNHISEDMEWDQINIAWMGEIEGLDENEQLTAEQQREFEKLLGPKRKPVWLDGPCWSWREYAEKVLWPTLHYSNSVHDMAVDQSLDQSTLGWPTYLKFNERFADVILDNYKDGDIIMIHDMYLMLVPSLLRKKLPDALIGLYVATPFPSSELFRMIPQRTELLNGMLGSTIIGFQSTQYIKHFVSAATRLTGIEGSDAKLLYDGRYIACVAIPFGINVKHVLERVQSERVATLNKEIADLYANNYLIVGRDKLDSTQGILQKLRAFLVLLEIYPQWRGKVVFVQITTITWQFSPWLEQEMSELISYINGKFGDLNYTPIVHFSRHLEQDEYFALLKTTDVGYFAPIREGASSAAIEYVLCKCMASHERSQRIEHASTIGSSMVLSEFMGIADLMGDCGAAGNPYDSLQMASKLNQALGMSKRATISAHDVEMFNTAKNHYDVGYFVKEFLSHLVLHDLKHENQHYTPEADAKELVQSFKQAKQRLILLDYDGTLTPIVRDPEAAVPNYRLKRILKALSEASNTTVWIISGRDMKFLDKHLAMYNINLSAEHGCYVKHGKTEGRKAQWEDLVSKIDMSWMKVVMDVLQSYTERTEGSSIEKKKAAITWHYRKSDPIFGAFQASHLRAYFELTVAQKYPVDVMAGKANIEIRPRLFNKGEIVRTIFDEAEKKNDFPGFVLCMGDDTTDEDMFRVLSDRDDQNGLFSVIVGPQTKLTLAKWHVNTVGKVHDLLESLIKNE